MNKHFRPIAVCQWRPAQLRLLAVVWILLMTGCLSQESLYRDIQASRTQAYQQWRQGRENQQESEVTVKGKLSLEDSIKLGLTYNKTLQAILQEREKARGSVVESYSEVLPKLSAVGNYTRLDEVGSFEVGGQRVSLGSVNNYSVDLQVQQPIFHGGAIPAALRAARLSSHLSDEVIRGQVQQTIFDVAQAYYDALLAEHLYAVNEEAVKSAQAYLEDVKRKRGQGVASEFDVLRAQVDVSNFRAEMIQQRNRIHLAKTQLLKAMGVSQDSDVELANELTYEPAKPVLEQAVRLAYENRPELYQAELAIHLQKEALRIARSQYWPRVDAVFTQGWSRPDPHSSTEDKWGDAWTAGVTAEWPLFDGLKREGRVIQEKALLKQKNIELLDAQERTLLEIQQGLLSLHDAEEFVESQRLNLDRATEGLRLAEVGYREGVNTEVEVTDARAALTRARGLYYKAIYSHTIARLVLRRATGILGPRAGDSTVPKDTAVRPAQIQELTEPSETGVGAKDQKQTGESQDYQGKE